MSGDLAQVEMEKYLSGHGVRMTSPRRAVAQAALGFKSNFTAEELVSSVRKRHAEVSRATVYRTLRLMVDAGALKAVDTGTGAQSFLAHFSKKTTLAEMVCVNCGRVETIEAPFMQWYAQGAAQKVGLIALEGRLQVRGECDRLKAGACPHKKV